MRGMRQLVADGVLPTDMDYNCLYFQPKIPHPPDSSPRMGISIPKSHYQASSERMDGLLYPILTRMLFIDKNIISITLFIPYRISSGRMDGLLYSIY